MALYKATPVATSATTQATIGVTAGKEPTQDGDGVVVEDDVPVITTNPVSINRTVKARDKVKGKKRYDIQKREGKFSAEKESVLGKRAACNSTEPSTGVDTVCDQNRDLHKKREGMRGKSMSVT